MPPLTFHQATIRAEAIALYPRPTETVAAIRDAIRQSIADLWERDRVPELNASYQPHLSLAYVNADASLVPVAEALGHLDIAPARKVIPSVVGIGLQRAGHKYRWNRYS